jgi:hypothetical protein
MLYKNLSRKWEINERDRVKRWYNLESIK